MNRRWMGEALAVVLALGAAWSQSLAAVGEALKIGGHKQLFVGPWTDDGRDEYLVESMENVTMTMNEARATGERLVVVDKPWEGAGNELPLAGHFLSVVKDDDVFRMYYDAMPGFPKLWNQPNCRVLCYAESTDGVRWKKPNLGLCMWGGSKDNNIVLPHDECGFVAAETGAMSVFIDPVAKSPDERYKMFIKIKKVEGPVASRLYPKGSFQPFGQYAFFSADGIHWKLATRNKVNPGGSDTQFSIFWDDRIEKYVAYTRMKPKSRTQQEYYREIYGHLAPSFSFRSNVQSVGRAVSDDFIHWGKETKVMAPDEVDWANSPPGQTRMDIHGGNVSKYPGASDVYLAFINDSYHWKYDMTRTLPDDIGYGTKKKRYLQLPRTMGVQLATSRDGIHWNRTPGRKPFIRLGPQGTFWSKMIFPNNDPVAVGDELWIYFCGNDVSLHESFLIKDNSARGRAVLRLDGFISADAAYTGGELTTRPLVFSGDKLQLNLDTSAGGVTKVEIQDESGTPIKGFIEDDSDEINGNYIRVLASWKGSTDVSSLAGRAVRLRFVMRDTKLYSFQFLP